MPRPLYILCSQSIAHDRITGMVSAFHILEGFQVIRRQNVPAAEVPRSPAQPTFMGVCVWMRTEDDDPQETFEYELTAQQPGDVERPLKHGEFCFKTRFYRFTTGFVISGTWQEGGDFVFRSKIRRSGSTEWMVQDFPIPVEVTVAATESAES